LGFAFHGAVVITVSNVNMQPDSWHYTYQLIPGTNNTLIWGSATLVEAEYLYLLGWNQSVSTLSRITIDNLQSGSWNTLQIWSYLSPDSKVPSWNVSPQGGYATLFEKIPETTIQFHPTLRKYFVLNIEFLITDIKIAWSDAITGPWSSWDIIYTIPSPWNDTANNVFCYAPKSHPELTKVANEIILTYASCDFSLDYLVDHLQIYDPQIIRVLVSP